MEKGILLRFLKCETTPEEEKRLLDWLEADPEHRKELDAMQLIMEGMALCAPELQRMNAERVARRTSLFMRMRRVAVAASVALVIAAGFAIHYFSGEVHKLSSQKTIVHVPHGQRMSITLNDGTEVWLNAGTQLEYPSVFSGKERRVKVSGEAMFEVTHDPQCPFIVETFACNINVLGTKFNVQVNEAAHVFSTALMSGSIKLISLLDPETAIIMKPNEEVSLVNGHLRLQKIENFDEYLWTDGITSIYGSSFEELMEKFERIYNVKIEIQRQEMPIVNYNRGKIRVSDGIDHALQMLKMASDFTYTKDVETGIITIK